MKHIIKQPEPVEFTEWKLTNNKFTSPIKRIVKAALMAEQGYLCCYCERRLTVADSHIEHFYPQKNQAGDALDYHNLLCSCQNQLQKGEPRHCGKAKDHWFHATLLISPLDSDCEQRFHFNANGTIRAAQAEDRAAQTTITQLKLDLELLNDLRNKAIEPFLDEDLTEEQLTNFVDGYLQKDQQGNFGEFWTTIDQLFKK
jgi:uncharacterized protein (TIGR02646 family)